MPKLIKFALPVIFWASFAFVVLRVDYPDTITAASVFQLSSFFISLFFALLFTTRLLLNFAFSLSVSIGIIILLVLKSLDSLNIVSIALTLIALYLLLSYFKKFKKPHGLTSSSKIPTLRSLKKGRQP